jgi:hypothetical protein
MYILACNWYIFYKFEIVFQQSVFNLNPLKHAVQKVDHLIVPGFCMVDTKNEPLR